MADVLMPRLSDTMAEGVLSQWLKKVGDEIRKGDVLAVIETDKATMELEAYDEGVLEQLLVPEGAAVPIGQPIAIIGDGSGGGAGVMAAAPPAPAQRPSAGPEKAASPAVPGQPAGGGQLRASPLSRRIARGHGIDLATITGTGPGGRIVRADVDAAVAAAGVASPPVAEAASPPVAEAVAPAAAGHADDEEIPLTAIRRITARRLTDSAAAPNFHLTSVIDAGPLLAFRSQVNDAVAATGTRISITDLLIRACAVTLRTHPRVNASWAGDKIIVHRRIHVGVAVAVDDGLIVPVIRDADRKTLSEIAARARELAERARAGKLTPEEFTGGTFTISNLGMFGIDSFTAVINPPEAAILAVGAAAEEPVIRDGQLASRMTIKLTLTSDHRVLDGATAAAFLSDLRDNLQEPLRTVI